MKIGIANSMGLGYNAYMEINKKEYHFKKGMVPWNKGKKLSEEGRKKMSIAHIGLPNHWKGKTRSESTKIKIANTLRGRKLPEDVKEKIMEYLNSPNSYQKSEEGRKMASIYSKRRVYQPMSIEQREKLASYNRGKVPSMETRLKLSEAHKGNKHYNWKGGITKENEIIRRSLKYRLWRESVFNRDDYTCQDCKIRGTLLHAHHIKSFAHHPELRFDILNGLTLCIKCHEKTDTYKNKRKNNATRPTN